MQMRQFHKVTSATGKQTSNSRAGNSSATGDQQFKSTQGGSNLKFTSKAEFGVMSQTINHDNESPQRVGNKSGTRTSKMVSRIGNYRRSRKSHAS